jgi:hypothetical protein
MDNLSPREAFLGRKLNYKVDLRAAFGDYIQAHVPNVTEQDVKSLNPRTSGAIVVMMAGNLQGSVKAVDLSTMRLVTRDKFTPLPMPPSVIEYLNGLASQQKRKISKDPVFHLGHSLREIVEDLSDTPVDDSHKSLLTLLSLMSTIETTSLSQQLITILH